MRTKLWLIITIIVLTLGLASCAPRTALHEASQTGDVEQVQSLIDSGTNLDRISRDDQADAALHRAVGAGHLEIARELIAAGADVNVRTGAFGWTPLHIAAAKGNDEMVGLLLDSGAEVNATDENQHTPLDYALAKGNEQTAELLRQRGGRLGGAADR
ncbi:MAG: ankyrin repeat domain-containing protein [Candidatus Alcyoniella australis]|nr:ankyrin repeat domain-containing protein [Candidatus Alcyoniella australis]